MICVSYIIFRICLWQHHLLEWFTTSAYSLVLWSMLCLCSWEMKEGPLWGLMTPESPTGERLSTHNQNPQLWPTVWWAQVLVTTDSRWNSVGGSQLTISSMSQGNRCWGQDHSRDYYFVVVVDLKLGPSRQEHWNPASESAKSPNKTTKQTPNCSLLC